MSSSEHEHEYDQAPKRGAVAMCVHYECTHVAVGTGHRWREPTAQERVAITIRMWEDLIIVQTMQIIHGKERGLAHARYVLGYGSIADE